MTEQIQQLQRQLQRESYLASPAKGFWLAKPSGGQRLIGISTVRDRLVQRYLLQQIYPALSVGFGKVFGNVLLHHFKMGTFFGAVHFRPTKNFSNKMGYV